MWDEGPIRAMAESRYGLVDRKTALWSGLTDHYISTQIELGRWRQPHPGVYYLNATPLKWRGRVLAAVMAGGDAALASHRTAGVLWGLEGFKTRAIEITVPFSDEPMPKRTIVHRTRRLLPAGEVMGIPATSVERTLLDLAASLPDSILEKAVMSALRKNLTRSASLLETLAEQGGRGVKGTRRFRRVLQLVDEGMTGSVAEVEAAQIIRDLPIQRPMRQLRVRLPDGANAYPDFSWPDRMKIVEVDGYETHGTPEQLNIDLFRQNLLMDLGWEIRRFSVDRIRREPLLVGEEIVEFIGR